MPGRGRRSARREASLRRRVAPGARRGVTGKRSIDPALVVTLVRRAGTHLRPYAEAQEGWEFPGNRPRLSLRTLRAKLEVERQSVAIQTELVAGGLRSDEARAFLEAMPTADALVGAAPSVLEIEEATVRRDRYGRVLS